MKRIVDWAGGIMFGLFTISVTLEQLLPQFFDFWWFLRTGSTYGY